jgi:hypothetical protein
VSSARDVSSPAGIVAARSGPAASSDSSSQAAGSGPLDELAAQAGYQVKATGALPLLRYVTAVKPLVPASPG